MSDPSSEFKQKRRNAPACVCHAIIFLLPGTLAPLNSKHNRDNHLVVEENLFIFRWCLHLICRIFCCLPDVSFAVQYDMEVSISSNFISFLLAGLEKRENMVMVKLAFLFCIFQVDKFHGKCDAIQGFINLLISWM